MDENEIDLKQSFDDDDDIGLGSPSIPADDDADFESDTVADDLTGFGLEDENGDAIADDDIDEFASDDDEFDDEM